MAFTQTHGWLGLLPTSGTRFRQRLRDRMYARRLHAPGFRAGLRPRVLGASHIHLGPDFHARDFLWIEAVLRYEEAGVHTTHQPRLSIGASARLSDNVHIACLDRVTVGDHLLCGSRVLISDHAHGSYRGKGASDPAVPPAQRPLTSPAPVVIGHNVWLGEGVAVLAGAQIGDGCVIGANSVVTGPIPAGTMAAGVPARPRRRWNDTERAWVPWAPVPVEGD